MERRKHPRTRCHVGCIISDGKGSFRGTVRDVSNGGLSLEAPLAGLPQGTALDLTLRPAGKPAVPLRALVWHERRGRRPETRTLGLVLAEASDDFFRFVEEAGGAGKKRFVVAPERIAQTGAAMAADAPADAPASGIRHSVRVKQRGRPRTCDVVVSASSAHEAREVALAEVGDGWSVLDVRAL